ncbi:MULTISPECIES: ankyrin repeat domain-containing protein [unclassified Pseudoalteromonas]|uniref:ankyrin repeat domain-containing protein n=1 Tax=unclassified Pseudoalteromonas TaxID=194690 RepID=UPI0016013EAA|nr:MULTISPECIES: ankyrin repeat domain-containing protein [unclassified Pseudoalteromonas]MBB1297589.1 ankyrin repeat domain-containing protein [Pseudoalteromonas sp. SR41-7]MBB1346821.1 ankyrin repeat domain-containing protein [Pseudoalteromonas sp. SG45-2]
MSKELIREASKFIAENDVESLQFFLKKHPELISHSFLSNRNWLHKAAKFESPDVISMLAGLVDKECVDDFGRTPLSSALISGKLTPTEKLVGLGANVNHNSTSSPLSCAVYSKSKELLKLLIENGANNESKEELIRYGRGVGYKNIEDDLNELNYVSAITETFKDKLSAHYGALIDVQSKETPCILYSKQAKGKFAVFSENINKDAEIMFEVTKQGFDTAEEVLTQSYPWLFDWLEVINQVEIDPTQRVIIITREVECTPYQGIALLLEDKISYNNNPVNIYRLFPLYQKEIDAEKQYGIAALLKQFEVKGVSQAILKNRKPIL